MIWRHRDGRHAVEVQSTTLGHVALVAFTHTGARLLDIQEADRRRDWRGHEADEVRAAWVMAASARYAGSTPEAWDALSSVVELSDAWKTEALAVGAVRAAKDEKAAKKATKKPRKTKKTKTEPQQEAAPDEDLSSGLQGGEW